MTKGELILTITTILGSLTLGLWITVQLTRKMKTRGLKVTVGLTLFIMTLAFTLVPPHGNIKKFSPIAHLAHAIAAHPTAQFKSNGKSQTHPPKK